MNIINHRLLFAEENSLWFRGYVVGKEFPGRKGQEEGMRAQRISIIRTTYFPFPIIKKKKKKKYIFTTS